MQHEFRNEKLRKSRSSQFSRQFTFSNKVAEKYKSFCNKYYQLK